MQSTLTIKDLSSHKELDERSMSAVRGGNGSSGSKVFDNVNFAGAVGGYGIGNTAIALNVAPITSVNAPTWLDQSSFSNVGGVMGALPV